MKKIIFKTGFILLCVGVVVFLLLPFLETTTPAPSTSNMDQAQVVTENPLNAISKRIASLFGLNKERKQKTLPGQTNVAANSADGTTENANNISSASADWRASANTPRTSATTREAPNAAQSQTIEVPPHNSASDYENASFQTDDGEWVLVQQTAPEHSAPGMHEVNVHENPYDQYVHQERARSFGPQMPKQEIPDSKWARIIQPVKNLLGFGKSSEEPSVSTRAAQHANNEKGLSLGAGSDKLASNKGNESSSFSQVRLPTPDITPIEWSMLTPREQQESEKSDSSSDKSNAREVAEALGNAKFPNPRTPKERQQREDFINQKEAELLQRMDEALLQVLTTNSKNRPQKIGVGEVVGCSDGVRQQTECRSNPTPDNSNNMSTLSEEQETQKEKVLEKERYKNRDKIHQETGTILEDDYSITVLLGPSMEKLNFDGLKQSAPEVAEKYEYLANAKNCYEKKCYWVPSSAPSDPTLKDAVSTVGWPQGDPLGVEEKLKQKANEENKKILETPINWIPYNEEDVKQLKDRPEHVLPSDSEVALWYGQKVGLENILVSSLPSPLSSSGQTTGSSPTFMKRNFITQEEEFARQRQTPHEKSKLKSGNSQNKQEEYSESKQMGKQIAKYVTEDINTRNEIKNQVFENPVQEATELQLKTILGK